METVATIIYWVKIVALVLVVALTLVAAWRETGRCKLQTWREIVIVLLAIVAFAGLVWIADFSLGWVWAVASILAATTLMFGSSYLFALAMLVMAFAVGVVSGRAAGEMSGAKPAAETPDTPS
jgi:hypothetical protein